MCFKGGPCQVIGLHPPMEESMKSGSTRKKKTAKGNGKYGYLGFSAEAAGAAGAKQVVGCWESVGRQALRAD